MQHMLVGEADRAMHLVCDGGAFGGGLAGADFRGGRFEQHRVVERIAVLDGIGGGAGGGERCRRFAGEPREVLLYGLEFADFALERHAFIGVSDAERQDRFKRAGQLRTAYGRPHQHQRGGIERRRRAGNHFCAIESHRIRAIAGEIFPFAYAAVARFYQSNRGALVAGGQDRNMLRILGERHAAANSAQTAVGVEHNAIARAGGGDRHRAGRRRDIGARQ